MGTIDHEPTVQQQARRIQRPSLLRSIFSNSDDSVDGDKAWQARTAGQSKLRRRVGWWLRNPGHDLLFYWVGTVGLRVRVTALEPERIHPLDTEGREQGGLNRGTVRVVREDGSTGWPRPFVSWAGPVHAGAVLGLGWLALVGLWGLHRLHLLPAWPTLVLQGLVFALAAWTLYAENVLAYVGWRLPDGAAGAKLRRWSDG